MQKRGLWIGDHRRVTPLQQQKGFEENVLAADRAKNHAHLIKL